MDTRYHILGQYGPDTQYQIGASLVVVALSLVSRQQAMPRRLLQL